MALDRPYLGRQERQQRGVVPGPGADIEYAVGRRQLQQLEHSRHHQRLRDRLPAVDR